jgi:hypothetical protein
MRVRLTRKLADMVDGIDLSGRRVGEVFDLRIFDAQLLIAEGWAEPHATLAQRGFVARSEVTAETGWDAAALLQRLRHICENITGRNFADQELRRIEDRIREELHDSRARTIVGGRSLSSRELATATPVGPSAPRRLAATRRLRRFRRFHCSEAAAASFRGPR